MTDRREYHRAWYAKNRERVNVQGLLIYLAKWGQE